MVAVSSRGHQLSGIRWDDVHFARGYDKWLAYGQAKTANVLFAVHLDALGRDAGVRAFALHPGEILTPLTRHVSREEMLDAGWVDEQGNVSGSFKTPEQGAATQVWAATSPDWRASAVSTARTATSRSLRTPPGTTSPTARWRATNSPPVSAPTPRPPSRPPGCGGSPPS